MHKHTKRCRTLLSLLSELNDKSKFDFVLASGSPRRRELLTGMGINTFRIITSNFPENLLPASFDSPAAYCLGTAVKKAEYLISSQQNMLITPNNNALSILISADTIVEMNGEVLEKPKDIGDAHRMLALLSGNTHSVHTGVSIFLGRGGSNFTLARSFIETSRVTFLDISHEDIEAYIFTGEPMDKSGGYGIQGLGGQFVSRIEGDYFNIMGLPVARLGSELTSLF